MRDFARRMVGLIVVCACLCLNVQAAERMVIARFYGDSEAMYKGYVQNGQAMPQFGTDRAARISGSSNGITSTNVTTQGFIMADKAGPAFTLKAGNSNPWGVGGYWQISFSAMAFENMEIDVELSGSNRAPGVYRTAYSVGNFENFVDFGDEIVIPKDSEEGNVFTDVKIVLPEQVENKENVFVRIYFSKNAGANPNNSIDGVTSGTVYLRRLEITGSLLEGEDAPQEGGIDPEDLSESLPFSERVNRLRMDWGKPTGKYKIVITN